jgi:hypothetical protein
LLDSFYNRPAQFAQDLLANNSAFKKIQYRDYENLCKYYVLLRTNIKEAKRAGLLSVLLSPGNMGVIEKALPAREIELWRERQSKCSMDHYGEALVEFIGLREDWALYSGCLCHNGSSGS